MMTPDQPMTKDEFLEACEKRGITEQYCSRPEEPGWQMAWSRSANDCRCHIEDELRKKYDSIDIQLNTFDDDLVLICGYNQEDVVSSPILDVEGKGIFAALLAAWDAAFGEEKP